MRTVGGRRVLVVGLGVSGLATARVLSGYGAKVRVTESKVDEMIRQRAAVLTAERIEAETGGHDLARLDADLAVVSPGIPPHAPIIRALEAAGVPMVSEIEVASWIAECDLLAVTGTNGKTTTTRLLAAMLSEAGIASQAAGNIGVPLIEAVSAVGPGGAIAVEVSSFQLEGIETFRPRVAVLLNVAEDHTDWHGSFDAYVQAKQRVVSNQGPQDAFVYNFEDQHASGIAQTASARLVPFSSARACERGIGVEGSEVVWRGQKVVDVSEVAGGGRAILEDAVAAAGAALEYGVELAAVRRAIRRFRPLPHRLELVAARGGIAYIDDSKATNPHATMSAVAGMRDVVLIAGGRSKGMDLSPLASTVPPVIAVVAIGEAAADIEAVFDGLVPVEHAASMHEAVELATKLAVPDGCVLLSPGCSSLDMYESYARRGEEFARAVRELARTEA